MESKLIEAGHYYAFKGPTQDAHIGMQIAKNIKNPKDKIMLFIDDVHTSFTYEDDTLGCGGEHKLKASADYHIYESETADKALELCDLLHAKHKQGDFYYQGIKLTKENGGKPTCVAMDSILTLLKRQKGHEQLINILPKVYQKQQDQLQIIVQGMKDKYILPETLQLLSLLFSGYESIGLTQHFKKQIQETFYLSNCMIGNQ